MLFPVTIFKRSKDKTSLFRITLFLFFTNHIMICVPISYIVGIMHVLISYFTIITNYGCTWINLYCNHISVDLCWHNKKFQTIINNYASYHLCTELLSQLWFCLDRSKICFRFPRKWWYDLLVKTRVSPSGLSLAEQTNAPSLSRFFLSFSLSLLLSFFLMHLPPAPLVLFQFSQSCAQALSLSHTDSFLPSQIVWLFPLSSFLSRSPSFVLSLSTSHSLARSL